MSNQTTKEADDVVVDKVEEGISNEEADAPATTVGSLKTASLVEWFAGNV